MVVTDLWVYMYTLTVSQGLSRHSYCIISKHVCRSYTYSGLLIGGSLVVWPQAGDLKYDLLTMQMTIQNLVPPLGPTSI